MPKITYLNKPRLSEHEVDRAHNEKRVALLADVDSFISKHFRFKDKEVSVFFVPKGVSSLVCVLETIDEKLILKIPLRAKPIEGEALFLKKWESVGVSVPHVIEEGVIANHPYLLMQYIDSKDLVEFYGQNNLVQQKVYVQMGTTLRQMHTTEAIGYGGIVDGKPRCTEFREWLMENDSFNERFAYVKEHNLLNDTEHGSLQNACHILLNLVQNDPRNTYCHNDFAPENIFATIPLTVFDPDPTFNHPFMDLARAIVIAISRDGSDAAEQFIEGYFLEEFDKKALQAAILLQAYLKFPYWHKVNRGERIEDLRGYLSEIKYILD